MPVFHTNQGLDEAQESQQTHFVEMFAGQLVSLRSVKRHVYIQRKHTTSMKEFPIFIRPPYSTQRYRFGGIEKQGI